METATIALVQLRPKPGSADPNAEKIIEFIRSAKSENADLVVFPECSLTGYSPKDAAELAVSADSEAVRSIERCAKDLEIAVCFGYMEALHAGNAWGRSFAITQEIVSGASKTVYKKTHLAGSEQRVFLEGNIFPTAQIPCRAEDGKDRSITAGMQLCWESHIPQISSAYRKSGAQLLLFPYASGMSGEKCRENWSVHLPARASDNGCFAAACNLLINEKGGGMAVWDPKGKVLKQYWGTDEKMISCSIGGPLPREIFAEGSESMHCISYFDRSRNELFEK